MNISTLAKILGVSINELRETGKKKSIPGFYGRNTRVSYEAAIEITKVIRPEKAEKLKDDDRIYVPSSITVGELSEVIGKQPGIVVKTLIMNGVMVTLNEKIDFDTASLIAEELGIKIYPEKSGEVDDKQKDEELNKITTFEANEGKIINRPPVVTVMGHVDHGKTTLLDTIRKSNIAQGEAGAITQHISGYQIEHGSQKITFVDTPGHEAFTAMRARGTQLADFIILMVSATEGPKPQTVEVIERAKLSKTPIIVAINKIDLPEADIEKAKNEITKFGLVPEEWGGETPFIPISAKNGDNIDKLLDTILLFSEVAELKGTVDCPGQAVVVESHKDPKLGILTTALVTKDKLKVGDYVRCGLDVAKIKRLQNGEGKNLDGANLAEPVILLGLNDTADIGEQIIVYESKKDAQNAVNVEKAKKKHHRFTYQPKQIAKDEKTINILLKADVLGSLEALKESILKIPQEKVAVNIVGESVGNITEGDLEFAKTTNSTILGFHTDLDSKASSILKNQEINIVQSDIIYEILNWVEEELLKHIEHEIQITSLGKAEILATFKSEKPNIQIVGGEVKEGKIYDNKNIRIWRGEEEIGRAEIAELQRNKVKSKEINVNQQFGISLETKTKIQKGDIIESIDEVVVK